jgi:UDP-GlcNAc:undecaprenyl-phosphate GlcNAc-1-phosphate transferase
VLSVVLTAIARRLAIGINFVAHPVANRHHRTIVPLGGGIAIFAAMSIVILSAMGAVKFLAVPGHLDWLGESVTVHTAGFLSKMGEIVVVLLCVLALFVLGLVDDKKHLGPFFKLAVQFAVALTAAGFAEVRVEFFIENKIITSALSAVWIVLIINAFNFLDNMDGLSCGIAAIAAAILFTAAAISGQVFVGGLAIVFIGTLLGFLVFNFPPARIFMGDAGSLVVGFFVALLSMRTTYYHEAESGQWYAVFLPIVVMHFSHRLKRHGLSDTQTVLTLYLATLCTGLGGTFLYQVNLAGALLIFAQTFMILAIIAIFETTAKNDKSGN